MAFIKMKMMEEAVLIQPQQRKAVEAFLESLNLISPESGLINDKTVKVEQILAYIETIYAQIRHYSVKRELVLVDAGAGNCYLSFALYFFLNRIAMRPVTIHCVDINERLMDKNRAIAREKGFDHMFFHGKDIADFHVAGPVHGICTLHACNDATDKALHLGLRVRAKNIFSVSCCQHNMTRQLRRHPYTGLTRHIAFKERLSAMLADSLRGLLMEMEGYEVDIIEFVSSRYTDKNMMLRASWRPGRDTAKQAEEYQRLRETFHLRPALEEYLSEKMLRKSA